MALIANADIQGQDICVTEAAAGAAIALTSTAKEFGLTELRFPSSEGSVCAMRLKNSFWRLIEPGLLSTLAGS